MSETTRAITAQQNAGMIVIATIKADDAHAGLGEDAGRAHPGLFRAQTDDRVEALVGGPQHPVRDAAVHGPAMPAQAGTQWCIPAWLAAAASGV